MNLHWRRFARRRRTYASWQPSFPTSALSTYARTDNQSGRQRTVALRRQSDDNSRIDPDALGRVGGGDTRWDAGSFDAIDAGWLLQDAPTMAVREKGL